ncbi:MULTISPECIES: ABC transporter permease subunit [unclassified Paenibacillus]|uniref:ABC transporter permease n=1 Tax=unclassified Paenibacillus TaxID=185978 RepID=UPI001053D2CC|nr:MULTISPECIES: ABC transporter permease subunit [unclassified Paenibacillus]NIK68228.1 putative aldouronate transport system permease protein [Paenibacillus sp. BK720]TCM99557.1 carbohydrate ABC transporter membrane protein 1 (CUT1 family) [Paenibacillus sp. BK033]
MRLLGGGLRALRRDYQLWIMIAPAIAVVLIFNYIPMYGIQLAFKDFDFTKGLTGGAWRGIDYFKQFIDSYLFTDLMRNTFLISLATIIVGFPAPIILALILNQIRRKRFKNVMQTTVYLPHFISIIVLVGMMNVLMSPETGVVGHMMKGLGLGDINLIASTNTFIPVYVLSDIWQHCGWNSIIYLAALSTVDPQLYDSAKIDGASRMKMIRYVDLPALVPTIIILFILSMGNILSTGFEKIFLMQNALNLPVSEVIATYVYKIGIVSNQFSYASAIGLFNTLINFVFLFGMNAASKKMSNTSLY